MSASAARETSGHSELMNQIYRRQRHIYDATRKYYLLGRDQMIRGLDMRPRRNLRRCSKICRARVGIKRGYDSVRQIHAAHQSLYCQRVR